MPLTDVIKGLWMGVQAIHDPDGTWCEIFITRHNYADPSNSEQGERNQTIATAAYCAYWPARLLRLPYDILKMPFTNGNNGRSN